MGQNTRDLRTWRYYGGTLTVVRSDRETKSSIVGLRKQKAWSNEYKEIEGNNAPRTVAQTYEMQYINKKESGMKKYVCETCGYVYDPAEGDPGNGIKPGTAFEDIPADWVCPECGMGKDAFSPVL